jgi:hypothetical protein
MTRMNWIRAGAATLLTLGMAASVSTAAAAAPARAHHHVLGDFDGDGQRDIAIGAPGGGRVKVVYTHARRHGSHNVFITGHASHAGPTGFGASLAIGDFNGDGFTDLAVGAPDYRPTHQHGGFENNPEPQGAVFVYLGSASGLHQQPLTLVGPYDGDEPYFFGSAIATGDVDNDGKTDLAATIPLEDPVVRVFYGSSAGLQPAGATNIDDLSDGDTVAFGDLNGDGHADLVIGSTFDETSGDGDDGSLTVHYGTAQGTDTDPHLILGSQVGVTGQLGAALDCADVNHDGFDDLVVGAPSDHQNGANRNPGSIVVLFGSRHGVHAGDSVRIQAKQVYSGTKRFDAFGAAVAAADVTGDGRADVVVGAPGRNVDGVVNAGAVYFLAGTSHGLSTAHAQQVDLRSPGVPGGAHRNGEFGAALYLAQLAGDSHRDLLAGAPNESDGASHGGYAVRLLGTAHGLTGNHAHAYGDGATDDNLGVSVR